MFRRICIGLVALACVAADGPDPVKLAERCELAPALSPFELADLAVVHTSGEVPAPPCVRRLLALGERAEKVLIPWLPNDDPQIRRRAAFVLGILGRPSAAPALAAALKDTPEAARALGRIGGEAAARSLASHLEAPGAAAALSAIGGPVAVKALNACATDTCAPEWLGAAGVDDLQAIPPPAPLVQRCADVVECWRGALSGVDSERTLAVRWLGRLGAGADVLPALRDPSPAVRAEARDALLRSCRGPCAEAAKALPESPELAPEDRVWLRYVLLRAAP